MWFTLVMLYGAIFAGGLPCVVPPPDAEPTQSAFRYSTGPNVLVMLPDGSYVSIPRLPARW
jgi:hypothetical protein